MQLDLAVRQDGLPLLEGRVTPPPWVLGGSRAREGMAQKGLRSEVSEGVARTSPGWGKGLVIATGGFPDCPDLHTGG